MQDVPRLSRGREPHRGFPDSPPAIAFLMIRLQRALGSRGKMLPAGDTAAIPATRPAARFAQSARALLEAMRPAQWQKNVLLFAAFVFSGGTAWRWQEPE